jgi:hypothetical protein
MVSVSLRDDTQVILAGATDRQSVDQYFQGNINGAAGIIQTIWSKMTIGGREIPGLAANRVKVGQIFPIRILSSTNNL